MNFTVVTCVAGTGKQLRPTTVPAVAREEDGDDCQPHQPLQAFSGLFGGKVDYHQQHLVARSTADVRELNALKKSQFLRQSQDDSRLLCLARSDQQIAAVMLSAEAYRYQQGINKSSRNDSDNKEDDANDNESSAEVGVPRITPPSSSRSTIIFDRDTFDSCLKDIDALMSSPLWDDGVKNPARDHPNCHNHPYLFTINQISKLLLFHV